MTRLDRWFAGLVLALHLAVPAGSSSAQPVRYWNQGKQITDEPKMHVIPNTDVYYQRRAPGYDLYRFADHWYLVDDGEWFESQRWRGPFVAAAVESLPEEVTFIPKEYRKYWEAGSETTWASSRRLSEKPKMTAVTRSGVSYASGMNDFDLYRYRSEWYLVENGQWHHSDSWKGPFLGIPYEQVPLALQNVPSPYRKHWKPPGT